MKPTNTTEILPANAVQALLDQHMPSTRHMDVLETWEHGARVQIPFSESQLRPGGTLSGPTMMALADATMYAAILANVGPEMLAVTTDFTIHFLNKPQPRALIAEAHIIKMGKVLIVINVEIYSGDLLVAHATGTYSRPPKQSQTP